MTLEKGPTKIARTVALWRYQTGAIPPEALAFPGVKARGDTLLVPLNAAPLVAKLLGGPSAPTPSPLRTAKAALPWLRPWVPAFLTAYQRAGIAAALSWPEESGMLAWAAGAGKTVASIIWGLAAGGITVAVTKASIRPQWAREVERFSTVPVEVLEGETPRSSMITDKRPIFFVTAYSTLPAWIGELVRARPASVIFDESHIVQSHRRWNAECGEGDRPRFTLRDNIAAAAYRLSRAAKRRLATTATPIRDRVRNLWAQLDLVDPGGWGTFSDFARRYCGAIEGTFGLDTRGSSHLVELKERISLITHRVSYAEASRELPPRIRQVCRIPVRDQVQSEGFAKELKLAAKHGRQALFEARLMEAASRKRKIAVDHAVDALESGGKVLIFTGRRRDAESIERLLRTRLPSSPSILVLVGHGGHSVEERTDLVDRYMARRGPAVLTGTGDAFGEGLNLQDTDLLIQVMLPWNTAGVIQREGRAHRLGQTRSVRCLYLVAEGTVDEHVAEILIGKIPAVVGVGQDEVAALGEELAGASEAELLSRLMEKAMGGA